MAIDSWSIFFIRIRRWFLPTIIYVFIFIWMEMFSLLQLRFLTYHSSLISFDDSWSWYNFLNAYLHPWSLLDIFWTLINSHFRNWSHAHIRHPICFLRYSLHVHWSNGVSTLDAFSFCPNTLSIIRSTWKYDWYFFYVIFVFLRWYHINRWYLHDPVFFVSEQQIFDRFSTVIHNQDNMFFKGRTSLWRRTSLHYKFLYDLRLIILSLIIRSNTNTNGYFCVYTFDKSSISAYKA